MPAHRLPRILVPALAAIAGLAGAAESVPPPSVEPAPPIEQAPLVDQAPADHQNPPIDQAPPLVVSATRLDAPAESQPYALYTAPRESLDATHGRTLTDKLAYAPGIHLQKTAANQSSPYVRGLTGEQTLLLFDGVRFNHALMRPGPNQYAAVIADEQVGRVDTILGSTAAVAGSDGLTGAIDFRLAEAGRGVERGVSPWVGTRLATADRSARVYGGVDGRFKDLAWSLDGSFADYQDLRGGKDSGGRLFGEAAGDRTIPNTGYSQYSYGGRVAYTGLARNRFEVAAGYTRQEDAPRPDGFFANNGQSATITATGAVVPRTISRVYDPQEFTYVHLRHGIALDGPVSRVQTTLWWHEHHEVQQREDNNIATTAGVTTGRYRRRVNDDRVDTLGADLQLTSHARDHELTYGATAYRDTVDSEYARFRSPNGNVDPGAAVFDGDEIRTPGQTTVPDDASYDGLGVFLQDSWQFAEDWNLLGGVRYSRSAWNYTVSDDRDGYNLDGLAAANPAVTREYDGSVDAITGNLRLGWQASAEWYHFVGLGQGFRAPNLSNLAGIQDRGSSGLQIQGNPDLEPEHSLTAELGTRWRDERDTVAASVFATRLRDLIQATYLDSDGDGAIDSARTANGEEGLLLGGELASDLAILPAGALPANLRLSLVQSVSYVSGEVDVPQGDGSVSEENISRANLFFGKAGLKLSSSAGWWLMPQVRWQDRYDEIAPGDANDPRHLTFGADGDPNGAMPGYAVLDVVAGYVFPGDHLRVGAAIENLLDHSYRPVGSGNDGAGLGAVLTVEARL